MCREQLSEPSRLERAVTRAREHHMLLSSGGSAPQSDDGDDDGDDDAEDEFFAVLEPILLELVRRVASGGFTKSERRSSAGFEFDDL